MKIPDLEDIPTECARCHRLFNDKDLAWVQKEKNEKWFVCKHCAEVINYCNRMIGMLRRCQEECKESLEVKPKETPMQRVLRFSRENSLYGSFIITSCDDCPYNSGVHGEEIICDFDHDPRDCPHKGRCEE